VSHTVPYKKKVVLQESQVFLSIEHIAQLDSHLTQSGVIEIYPSGQGKTHLFDKVSVNNKSPDLQVLH